MIGGVSLLHLGGDGVGAPLECQGGNWDGVSLSEAASGPRAMSWSRCRSAEHLIFMHNVPSSVPSFLNREAGLAFPAFKSRITFVCRHPLVGTQTRND